VKADCPDGTCDSSETCCELDNGDWGCCPYQNADCCSDKAHCCPNGYKCDLVHMQCVKENHRIILSSIISKLKADCPDGTCDSSETCCELDNGDWGCCPYQNADCCSDKAHCCPNGYKCDLVHMQCVKENHRIILSGVRKVKADCPDGTCDSSETCCELDNGDWGCCPYQNADCCSDKAHCCPNGYKCDLVHMQCVKENNVVLLSSIISKLKADCPDGTCDSSETCCELDNGDWGCCPYQNADCCSDKAHCCPNGYKCDLVHMQCVKENSKIMLSRVRN